MTTRDRDPEDDVFEGFENVEILQPTKVPDTTVVECNTKYKKGDSPSTHLPCQTKELVVLTMDAIQYVFNIHGQIEKDIKNFKDIEFLKKTCNTELETDNITDFYIKRRDDYTFLTRHNTNCWLYLYKVINETIPKITKNFDLFLSYTYIIFIFTIHQYITAKEKNAHEYVKLFNYIKSDNYWIVDPEIKNILNDVKVDVTIKKVIMLNYFIKAYSFVDKNKNNNSLLQFILKDIQSNKKKNAKNDIDIENTNLNFRVSSNFNLNKPMALPVFDDKLVTTTTTDNEDELADVENNDLFEMNQEEEYNRAQQQLEEKEGEGVFGFGEGGTRKRKQPKRRKTHKKHFSKKCHKTLKRKCKKTLRRKSKKTLRRKKT